MGLYGNEALKILNEIKVYQDDEITITVDGSGSTDRNFDKKPYLKYIKGKLHSDEKIRISFDGDPEYIIHNNEKYKLSSKEKKELNEIMDKKSTKEFNGLSVWEAIKAATIRVSKNINEKDKERINNIEKPDFRKLK